LITGVVVVVVIVVVVVVVLVVVLVVVVVVVLVVVVVVVIVVVIVVGVMSVVVFNEPVPVSVSSHGAGIDAASQLPVSQPSQAVRDTPHCQELAGAPLATDEPAGDLSVDDPLLFSGSGAAALGTGAPTTDAPALDVPPVAAGTGVLADAVLADLAAVPVADLLAMPGVTVFVWNVFLAVDASPVDPWLALADA